MAVKKWTTLSTELVAKARVFSLMVSRMRSPDGGVEDDYYTIDCPDWNNVIALTSDNQVVMIEQYRHGVDEISLEIPGGIIDPDESPEIGAIRELAEETGYTAKEVHSLGWVHPNPAIQPNKCHLFLATGAELTQTTNLDHDEDIEVRLVPLEDIPKLVFAGKFTHSMMVAAFFKYFNSEFYRG